MSNNNLIKGTINIIYEDETLYDWFNKKIHDLNIIDNQSQYNEYRNKKNVIVSINSEKNEYVFDLMTKNIVFEKNGFNFICNNIKLFGSYLDYVPLYCEIINGNHYFNYNDDVEIKEQLKIIYSNNIKNEMDKSFYNCIFCIINHTTKIKNIVFLIRKLKYGNDTHRYIFSYDTTHFTKNQIEILLYYIFCLKRN